jgi:hypothetical protein
LALGSAAESGILHTLYVAAGATKAAEVVGEAVATKAGKLLGRVRAGFSGDREATTALENFEKKPSLYEGVVRGLLSEKAGTNPVMLDELRQLLDDMGPRVDVFQKIGNLAGQATGLDLAKWEKGLAVARQEVETVEKGATLIGAKVGEGKP